MQHEVEQQLLLPPLLFCRWSKTIQLENTTLTCIYQIQLPCELGSGKFSLGTRCMTVVLPNGNPNAPNVTLLCKNRPWYINLNISAFDTASWLQSRKTKFSYFQTWHTLKCPCHEAHNILFLWNTPLLEGNEKKKKTKGHKVAFCSYLIRLPFNLHTGD